MSKYEKIKTLSEVEFRRLTGVQKATFYKVLKVYESGLSQTKKLSDRPALLNDGGSTLDDA